MFLCNFTFQLTISEGMDEGIHCDLEGCFRAVCWNPAEKTHIPRSSTFITFNELSFYNFFINLIQLCYREYRRQS